MTLNYRSLFDQAVESRDSFTSPFDQPQQRQEQDASTTGQSNPDQPGADSGSRNAILDILAGVGNGIGNAVDSTVGLTGIDIGLEDIFGETETFAGSAVEGLTQFAVGFVPVFGALSKAGKFSQIGRGLVASAAADFAVFDGQEEKLSNLIQEIPGLANPVTEFLAMDEDDSQIEGRIKNVLEGAAIGSLFDGFVFGLRQLKAGRKARAEGLTPEEAFERVREVEKVEAERAKDRPADPYTQSVADSLNIDGREAEALVALQDAMGIERDSVRWERGGTPSPEALYQDSPIIDTPEFRNWFKGSKTHADTFSTPGNLGNPTGPRANQPLIAYHATLRDFRNPEALSPHSVVPERLEQSLDEIQRQKDELQKPGLSERDREIAEARLEKAEKLRELWQKDVDSANASVNREGHEVFNTRVSGTTDDGYFGLGAYFSPDPEAIRSFTSNRPGSRIMPVFIGLKNPYVKGQNPKLDDELAEFVNEAIPHRRSGDSATQAQASATRDFLEGRGFDGRLVPESERLAMPGGEVVVFDNTRIKSIFNKGEFDPTNPGILHQTERGYVDFGEDTQAVIRGLSASDFSTGVHELAHVARRQFINMGVDAKARLGIEDANIKVAEEWAGAVDGKWTVEAEEKFAQGFERYISEGKAPNSQLESLFASMRDFMLNVYRRIRGDEIGIEVSPQMREVFDKLVDAPEGRASRAGQGGGGGQFFREGADDFSDFILPDIGPEQVRAFIQKGTDLQEGAFFQDVDLTTHPRSGDPETRELLGLRTDHYSIIEAAGDEGAAAIEFHRRERLMPVVRAQIEAEGRGVVADADIALEQAEAAVSRYQRTLDLSSREEALALLQRRLGSVTDLRARKLDIEVEETVQRMGFATAARDHAAETKAIQEKIDRGTVTDAEMATWAAMDRTMNELTAEIMGLKSSSGRSLRNLKDIPNYIGGPGGAPVLQAYERIMADAGGRKGIERRIKALSEKAATDGDGIFVHEARKANRSNALNVTLEYWMNSILSGLKTLNINAIGGAAVTMYRPLEGMLGAAARGHWKEAQTYVETYMDLLDSTSEAWRYTKQSFGSLLDEGENVLLPDSRSFQDGEARRAISAEAFGKADDSPMGKALNGTGAIVRLPSRSLQATDEFFKQLNARAIVKRGLRRQGLDSGLNGEDLARFVEDGVDKVITDGELRTIQTLQRRAFETAKAANPQATEEQLRKLTRKEFNDLWEKEGKHTEPLVQAAKEYAEDVTFTRALPKGSISKGLQDIVVSHPYLRFVLPFVRTPVNLLSAAYERSPIAVARHAGEVIRENVLGPNFPRLTEAQGKLTRELNSPDPAVATEAYGRMYMASGTTLALMGVAANGNLTGRGPTDKELRRQLEATGWQPYSVKIGDTYVSYNRLDPFATVIGIVADMHDYGRWADVSDQGEIEKRLWGTISALTQNFTNKSYVTGIRSFVELLQNPEANANTEVARLGASFIPSIIGQSAGVTDPYARELRSFSDSFANRIPYLSENLDPVRNVLGEPVDRARSLGGESIPLFNAFLPIAARSTKDKKIHQELALLSWPFSPPPKSKQGQDLTQIELPSGHSAYDRWSELTGQVRIGRSTLKSDLRRLISSSRYQALPPESEPGAPSPRVEEIRKVLRRYRNRAWSQLLREVPELRQATTTFERERTLRRRGGRQPIGF